MQETIVIGCGGGGCKTVSRFNSMSDIPVITVNTGANDPTVAMSGSNVVGCLGDPDLAWALATDYRENIQEKIVDFRNVILTAGLGGGTGAGAVPVISKCAKDNGSQSITVVTLPMMSEADRRERSLLQMREVVDSSDRTILVDITKMLEQTDTRTFLEAVAEVDNQVCRIILKIADLLNGPFKSVLSERIYTAAYATANDVFDATIRSLDLGLFESDIMYGKLIICSESPLTRLDKEKIVNEISGKTGIVPEVISGTKEGGNGVMTFIPISYRTLLS